MSEMKYINTYFGSEVRTLIPKTKSRNKAAVYELQTAARFVQTYIREYR